MGLFGGKVKIGNWDPGKTADEIVEDPSGAIINPVYAVGGKNERELMDKASGGLAGKAYREGQKYVDPYGAKTAKKALGALGGSGIFSDGIMPQSYNPGSHTISASPFHGSGYKDYQAGFKQLAAGAQHRGPSQMGAAPQINLGPQDQFRQGQQDLIQQLAQQAAGQGPSLATLQMQQNTDDAIKSALALAATGRSGTAGGRLKMAQDQAAMMQQQGARDSAMMRIQEQLAARDQLSGVLGQARQGDIGLATNQADLDFRTGALNADLAYKQNALNDQTGLAYNQMAMGAYTNQLQDQQAYQKLLLDQYLAQEQLKQQGIASENALKGGLMSAAGQGLATAAAAGAFSDKNLKTNIKDGKGATKDFLAALASSMGIKEEPDFTQMPEGDRMKEFLSRIKGYEYDYKNPEHGEGPHVSPMAQDLEATDLGKALVQNTPEGKMVDYGKAGGLMLGGLAVLSQENDELRAMVEKLAKKRSA